MPKLKAESHHASELEGLLAQYPDLIHLRVRRRADLLTLESGPEADPFRHARLRKVGVHIWTLEMASRSRWEPTGMRGLLKELVPLLVEVFGWVLTPFENSERISDPRY